MAAYLAKVFIAQKEDGEVLAVKLRFEDAHAIAKRHAPCRVLFALADKGNEELNVVDFEPDHKRVQLIAQG